MRRYFKEQFAVSTTRYSTCCTDVRTVLRTWYISSVAGCCLIELYMRGWVMDGSSWLLWPCLRGGEREGEGEGERRLKSTTLLTSICYQNSFQNEIISSADFPKEKIFPHITVYYRNDIYGIAAWNFRIFWLKMMSPRIFARKSSRELDRLVIILN